LIDCETVINSQRVDIYLIISVINMEIHDVPVEFISVIVISV